MSIFMGDWEHAARLINERDAAIARVEAAERERDQARATERASIVDMIRRDAGLVDACGETTIGNQLRELAFYIERGDHNIDHNRHEAALKGPVTP